MSIKEKIKAEFQKKFSDVKTEFVFIDDHEKTFDNSDYKKFQNAAKKYGSKSITIEDKKVAYVIIAATGKYPRMIIYFTTSPIKENKMNKLMESKLRRLIQKEIKKSLNEVDSDTETNFNYFIDQLETFIKDNGNSKYQPQIKLKGDLAETKWLSINKKIIEQLLGFLLDKKYLFKKD